MAYRLLSRFEETFRDGPYRHRDSSLGNKIANYLYDDLYEVDESGIYRQRVAAFARVLNRTAKSPGVRARRGDGSFGQLVPGAEAIAIPGFLVASGPTASTEIGVEVKILAKAMIKQIDRVSTDLRNQAGQFKLKNPGAITVGIVGINNADHCTSYEGDRAYPTDGHAFPHPIQEAGDAARRLHADAEPSFDEFIVLGYEATNEMPFHFSWVSLSRANDVYGSALVRILNLYTRRFG